MPGHVYELVWGEPSTFVKRRRVRRKHPLYLDKVRGLGRHVLYFTLNVIVQTEPAQF